MLPATSEAFTIERAGCDEATFRDVFAMLLEQHKEIAYFPLDADMAARTAYLVLHEGMSLIARNGTGEAIGHIGITEVGCWYSRTKFLHDRWLYIRPEYRGGRVLVKLLRSAAAVAQERGQILFVSIDNPDRRLKKMLMSLVSIEAGFIPFGYNLQLR